MVTKRTAPPNPNAKKPEDQKSRTYAFRLNPDDLEEKEVIKVMHELMGKLGDTKSPRNTIKYLIGLYLRRSSPPPPVQIPQDDYITIRDALEWIAEKIESGELGSGKASKAKGRTKKLNIPEPIANAIHRYTGRGLSADDLENFDFDADDDDE